MAEYHPTVLDDAKLLDFNFCFVFDPSLAPGEGPSASWLYRLAYLVRLGGRPSRTYANELADTIERTLSKEAFESFQHACGRRPIRYEDWRLSKLYQFLSVLLYEQLYEDRTPVGPDWPKLRSDRAWAEATGHLTADPVSISDEILEAFPIERTRDLDWSAIVVAVSCAKGDRIEALKLVLAQERPGREASTDRSTRLTPRDAIVLSCLERGEERRSTCETLDRKGIPTTPKMQSHGLKLWVEAWDDPEFKNNVQQMISKTRAKA